MSANPMRYQVLTPVPVIASIVVLAATVAIRAQQAPPATLVPVTAASLATQTDRYIGQVVAIYGTVEAGLSRTTFLMDQDPKRTVINDVLVIAPNLSAHAKPGEYVTVVGEVMRFDPAVIATKAPRYKLDLPADADTRYRGKVMVLATSVVDGTMTELAKFVPPPLTPEETAFDAVMKQVNPTFGELRKGVEASDAAIVKTQGSKLRDLFAQTRVFFAKRSVPDAQGWAGDAVSLVEAVTKGAASNDWAAAQEAASKIQPLCAQCHNAHRERLEDGSYRVKVDDEQLGARARVRPVRQPVVLHLIAHPRRNSAVFKFGDELPIKHEQHVAAATPMVCLVAGLYSTIRTRMLPCSTVRQSA